MTYEEWRDFVKRPEAIAVMPFSALAEPCPKCGEHEGYGVANDGHAYCNACKWGTATDYPFTSIPFEVLDKTGRPGK